VLFFGCRERAKDFLYEEELNTALASGHLSNVLVAFSREQNEKVPFLKSCVSCACRVVAVPR
jgi:NADPH-ferrihemoprotein reductase